VEVGGRVPLGPHGALLRPFASAGIAFIAASDWAATARFAAQPSGRGFRAATPIPDALGRFTLGAEILGTGSWDLRVQYIAEAGEGYTGQAGTARVTYRF
jgi:hypothetical protein